MIAAPLLFVCCALPGPGEDADARARAAFAALSAGEQRELIDFLQSELDGLRTFQLSLVRWVTRHQERDPADWPLARDAAWFDPAVHAPAQPIPRRALSASDARVVAARKQLLRPRGAREPQTAWSYDYGTRGLVRRRDADEPARHFENALLGLPPRFDLCEALVEMALDDGSHQRVLDAFSNAYTDRSGNVYPGITLYDAWFSKREIEMPDVDCLGIVHHVLDDWTTWRSIVPSEQHAALYARIGALIQPAQRHRELRHALARTFLRAAPEQCCGYEGSLDNFHALWEDCSSLPESLRARLPDAEGWQDFLARWVAECHERGELYQRGIERRKALERDARDVRATLERVLAEYGAFERAARRTAGTGAEKTRRPH